MSTILKENNYIRDLLNVTQWHNANILGKNTTAVVLDGKGKPRKGMETYYTDVFGNATESGHGTNVAQTIHEISPLSKILYFDNRRDKDNVFLKVEELAIQGKCDVINVSMAGLLGQETPDYLRYKELCEKYGILMVCGSGNDYYTDHVSFPSAYDFTISIGSTNKTGDRVDAFSNKGEKLTAVCPDYVSIVNSEGKIWIPSGTSYATPVSVGLFLLYISLRKENNLPKLNLEEAVAFIEKSCVDILDVGKDWDSGYGMFKLPDLVGLKNTLLKEETPIPPIQVEPEKPKEPEIIINPPSLTIPEQPKGDDAKMPKYKVALNAGHGMKNNGVLDVGAVGATGYKEYIQTKELTDLVDEKLKHNGIETLIIQDGDLWDVTNLADDWGANYFVSIHCNSVENQTAHGVETFALSSGGNGEKLAKAVHKELIPATGLYDRGVKFANYHVLRETDMSACLTEVGFISNPKEEALMKDPVWDNKVASGIAKGICNFLNISYREPTSTPSPTPSPSNNVMYRVIVDGKQTMSLSNLDNAIAELKRQIDISPTAKNGIIQGNSDNSTMFTYAKKVVKKSGKIIFYIYDDDSHACFYLSKYLGGIKYVSVKEMTQDIFDNYTEIYQVGGKIVNSNVTNYISGVDMYNTLISVLKHIGKI